MGFTPEEERRISRVLWAMIIVGGTVLVGVVGGAIYLAVHLWKATV